MTEEHTLIGNERGQVDVLDPRTAKSLRQLYGHTDRIQCIVYCATLDVMITGSNDKTARVWNSATGDCVRVLKGHISSVSSAAVHDTMYVSRTTQS